MLQIIDKHSVTMYFRSCSHSHAFSRTLSLLIQPYSGLVDILLQALVVLPPLLNKTSLMIKTPLTLRKSAPRRSPSEAVWGCVWCISSLIQTEGQDVVHKQGRGWRHIICVFWIELVFQFGLDVLARGLTTLITVRFHSGRLPRHHYKDDNFWSEIQTAKLESRLCR